MLYLCLKYTNKIFLLSFPNDKWLRIQVYMPVVYTNHWLIPQILNWTEVWVLTGSSTIFNCLFILSQECSCSNVFRVIVLRTSKFLSQISLMNFSIFCVFNLCFSSDQFLNYYHKKIPSACYNHHALLQGCCSQHD